MSSENGLVRNGIERGCHRDDFNDQEAGQCVSDSSHSKCKGPQGRGLERQADLVRTLPHHDGGGSFQ